MTGQQPAARPGMSRYLIWGFAALGVLAAGAVIFLAVVVLGFMGQRPYQAAPVAGKTATERYTVQDIENVRGTSLIGIEIGLSQGSVGSYSGRGDRDQRNLILLDKTTGTSRRLLTDNSRHLETTWLLPAKAEARPLGGDQADPAADIVTEAPRTEGAAEARKPPIAYYVVSVRQPKGELLDLLVGEIGSGHQAFVLSGIDGVDRIWMLTPTRIGLLLRQGMKLHYRVIDVPTLKVVVARPVEID